MDRSWWLDTLILALLALGVYSVFLGAFPLINPDEGRYSDIARHLLSTGNTITPILNGIPFYDKPILFYWIQSLFIRSFGVNEWAVRLWPIIIASFGCWMTYFTGRRLYNRRTGWLAALILMTSLFYFMMAHIADLDLTVAVFIASSLLFFLVAVQDTSHTQRSLFWLAYTFAGFAILTKGLIGIVLPMIVIGLWILVLNKWSVLKKMHLITGLLLILLINLPWFLSIQRIHPHFFHYFFYDQQFHRYVTHQFNSRHGLWFYPFILTTGMLPWTVYWVSAFLRQARLTWNNRYQYQKQCFLFCWIVGITVFFSIPISKTMGYILPVFPAMALITAIYLDTAYRHRPVALRRCAYGTAGLFICLSIGLLFLPYTIHTLPLQLITLPLHVISLILLVSALLLLTQTAFLKIALPAFAAFLMYPFLMYGIAHEGTQLGISSSKSLAVSLKPLLKPKDTVLFFDYYYQDLAFYLQHDVLLAGDFAHEPLLDLWRQDFVEGLKQPSFQNQSLTPKKLNELWKKPERMYLFTKTKQLNKLERTLAGSFYLMAQNKELTLVTNHPLSQKLARWQHHKRLKPPNHTPLSN